MRARNRVETVKELLSIEAASIIHAAENLDGAEIEKALSILEKCDGKVIITGVGKSGVIAQKVSQTLTSTGTPSLYLNPSDAMHGGLGIIASADVFVALSNSGETEELLAITPSIRRKKVPIISIVGNTGSSLARQSDVVLNASVDREACPLNLAPTASTTVALAVGDALAMALMDSKGLTEADFAANHPAGRLGKRLTITVGDLMHPSPNISKETGWLFVVKAISDAALGAVNVVDSDGVLIGIVTDGDLRRTIENTVPGKFDELTAEQMMTPSPITALSKMLAFDALRIMEDRPSQISVLPVVEDGTGRAIGLLRLHDIVRIGF